MLLQRDRQQAGRHLLARGDDGVVFPGVVQAGDGIGPADQLIGRAGHGRDDHGHLWPASTSRLTRTATALMRSTSATEVPPNFITMRVLPAALVIG